MKTEEKETLLLEGDKDESQDPNGQAWSLKMCDQATAMICSDFLAP
jgi:hypothetical protein